MFDRSKWKISSLFFIARSGFWFLRAPVFRRVAGYRIFADLREFGRHGVQFIFPSSSARTRLALNTGITNSSHGPRCAMREPNVAHRAIVSLHEAGKLLAVVTQNIDGLHQKAGLPKSSSSNCMGRIDGLNALLAKGVLSRSRSSMHSPRRHGLRVAGIVRDGLSRQLSVLDRILTRRR